jgi:hypothetical protein
MHRALLAQTGRAGDTAMVHIAGMVRDLGTQRPIAGATVATGEGMLATSDSNGDFTINGIFFTRTDIERHQPIVTSDLVRLALGVRVMDSLGVRLFASARGDKVVDDRYGRRTVPCIMRVGVDGQIMDWAFAADNVAPSDIYGIEVYSGPGSIPREYAALVTDGYCGLVMIWTR